MSATLFTSSKYSATDAAGLPLAGGKVYTYRAGTLTPAETYTNQSGTTPNTNPIILDAAGRASVWLGPYAYRIIVKDANDVLMPDGDQDNIIAPLATIQLTDPITELMLGNGTANPLTLTQNPGSIDNLGWVLGGVSQTPGVDFTLSGVTVSPTSAVPSGVPGFFNYRVALPIGTTSASLVSFTQAGSAAVARDASDKLFDVVSLTDFMTSAQKADARTFLGLLDLSAVFQAAIDAIDTAGGGTVEIPPGRFRKLSTTTKATSKSIRIRGSGMGVTTIVKQGDSDCFAFTNTAGTSTFCFESMTIAPATNMTTGAAISLRSDNVLPAVRMSNLFIGGSSGGEFKYGVKMKNCTEAQFDGVTVYGLNAANLIAFDLSCTVAATVPKWTKCSVYNALTGVNILSSTAPGIEGVQFYGTELVGVAQGVVYNNTVAAYAYFAPQFVWQGGHINASVDCINLTQMTQPIIQGGLFYNSGATGNHVKLTSCSGSNIQGNTFISIGGACDAIVLTSGTLVDGGIVAGNFANLASGYATVNVAGAASFQNLLIERNRNIGSGGVSTKVTGTISVSTYIRDNLPLDTDDISAVISPGTTLSLAGLRSNVAIVQISAPGSATTATTLTGGRPGQIVRLMCGSANMTLQNNATNPDGFALKGGANKTFTAGGETVVLGKLNGGYWTQL